MRLAARKKDKAQWIDFLKKNKKKTNGKWVQNYYSEVLNPPPSYFRVVCWKHVPFIYIKITSVKSSRPRLLKLRSTVCWRSIFDIIPE